MSVALILAENDGISIFGASILGASNLGMSKEGALGASGILKSIFGASGSFGASGILKDGASGACAHIDHVSETRRQFDSCALGLASNFGIENDGADGASNLGIDGASNLGACAQSNQ